jgi:glutathione S-transferase
LIRLFLDLDGKDKEEKFELDQILELMRDMYDQISPYFLAVTRRESKDQDKLRDEKLKPNLEKFLPYFESYLKESGSGFFVKSGVSYVDFYVADFFYTLHGFEKDLFEKKYSFMIEHYKKVKIC